MKKKPRARRVDVELNVNEKARRNDPATVPVQATTQVGEGEGFRYGLIHRDRQNFSPRQDVTCEMQMAVRWVAGGDKGPMR